MSTPEQLLTQILQANTAVIDRLTSDEGLFQRFMQLHQVVLDQEKARFSLTDRLRSESSEAVDKLSEALAKAQGNFPPIQRRKKAVVKTKDKDGKYNGEYTYWYADLADILEAVRNALSISGLAVTQSIAIESRDNGSLIAVVVTTLRHSSGQWLRSVLKFPTKEQDIQKLGSVFTYLRRYSIGALLGIAPEEDDDAELATRGEEESRREAKQQAKAGKGGDKSNAGDMPTDEQLEEFWVEWRQLWPTRFHTKEESVDWLKQIELNPKKANIGQLRSILSRLKVKKALDGQADQAPPNRGGAAGEKTDKKAAAGKGKEAKPKLTPEEQKRQAIQGRWSILVGDKFKGIADKELATEAACWWAAVHYGWVRNPETQQEKDGRIWPTRPRATLTPIDNIKAAVDAIADLGQADVEEMLRDYSSWIHDRLLELNSPAEGAQ